MSQIFANSEGFLTLVWSSQIHHLLKMITNFQRLYKMCIVVEESLEKDYLVNVCLQAVSKYRK